MSIHEHPEVKRLLCGRALGVVTEKALLDCIKQVTGEDYGSIAVDSSKYTLCDQGQHGWPGKPLRTVSGWCRNETPEEKLVTKFALACRSYAAHAGETGRQSVMQEKRQADIAAIERRAKEMFDE